MGDSHVMSSRKKSFRLRLLIYPRFQLTLIIANTVMMSLAFAFIGVQVARSFSKLKQMGINVGLPESHAYYLFLDFHASTLYYNLGIAIAAGFFLSALITLFVSHRLAGPLVRLTNHLTSIVRGERPIRPLSFRKHDFSSELPALFNSAIESVQKNPGSGSPVQDSEEHGHKKAS